MENLHSFILRFLAKRNDQTSNNGVNAEKSSYCALFLTLVIKMLERFMKKTGQIIKIFNPSIIQCDKHFSNQNGIEEVLAHEFVENRTASCCLQTPF